VVARFLTTTRTVAISKNFAVTSGFDVSSVHTHLGAFYAPWRRGAPGSRAKFVASGTTDDSLVRRLLFGYVDWLCVF
jgi:hypothetical protein